MSIMANTSPTDPTGSSKRQDTAILTNVFECYINQTYGGEIHARFPRLVTRYHKQLEHLKNSFIGRSSESGPTKDRLRCYALYLSVRAARLANSVEHPDIRDLAFEVIHLKTDMKTGSLEAGDLELSLPRSSDVATDQSRSGDLTAGKHKVLLMIPNTLIFDSPEEQGSGKAVERFFDELEMAVNECGTYVAETKKWLDLKQGRATS